jgi:glyceraldehyde-3-phosphate dehydrogenase (NADP+)
MKMLLGGQWVDRDEKIEVIDPFDNSVIDTVPSANAPDCEMALAGAVRGFEITKRMTVYDRAKILYKAAGLIAERLEEFATIIAREGSKTINEARKEASRCVNTITCSAEEAKRILGETIPWDSFPGGEKRRGYYYRFPVGIVLAITPFNDPLNLVAHKLGPAIAAGNAVILKPATVTPLSAIKLVEVLVEAGLPPEAIQLITGYGSRIGDALVSDERVRMISFTGGVEAGKLIAAHAGMPGSRRSAWNWVRILRLSCGRMPMCNRRWSPVSPGLSGLPGRTVSGFSACWCIGTSMTSSSRSL